LNSERILGVGALPKGALPLYSVAQIRAIESQAAAGLPPHTLMQRAGLALARLTLAVAPHARTIWIACGPGNNGGDGFEAAAHLKSWGKNVSISHIALVKYAQDASKSIANAIAAGIPVGTEPPAEFDVCIDALFGVGLQRPLEPVHAAWVNTMHASGKPIVAVDCPSGLDTDTGCAQATTVRAHATLTFLGLKPGLFTNAGRDSCGDIWLDTLLVPNPPHTRAQLNPSPSLQPRLHASHKGSYGDVAVVGGDAGMWGAALLAARATLHYGAGRVYVAPLDPSMDMLDAVQPELMFRSPQSLHWDTLTVVAGCGGGTAIGTYLPSLVTKAAQLVLDADALNQLAAASGLTVQVRSRPSGTTVLTPHPLEAARLLNCSTGQVQADRLLAAQSLADQFGATVVLKGSGTIIAAPGQTPRINPTGNARLATGGTGDVLAGMVGAVLASGLNAFEAASSAVYAHGLAAHAHPDSPHPLPASDVLRSIA
jgi:hydroxyethylthiazole kinase-like uncharacterized protein yjeF